MDTTPIRSCLACRRSSAKANLVRLAVDRGAVTVDALGRMPGRGAYLCARRTCLDAALRRDAAAVARALRLPPGRYSVDDEDIRAKWNAAAEAVTEGGRHDRRAGRRCA